MTDATAAIRKQLFENRDEPYAVFNAKLIPEVDKDRVIGVRTPVLRGLAKSMAHTAQAEEFLKELPHTYFEENNLHAFLLESIRDFDEAMERVEEFLPYVDTWATCDQMNPPVFKKNLPRLLEKSKEMLMSDHVYTVRYGIGLLMRYFLEKTTFTPDIPALVAGVKRDEYYISMMQAWFFATALAKQYDAVLPYLENRRLDRVTHNRAIQKAVESRRITPEQKAYLKTLKIKKEDIA